MKQQWPRQRRYKKQTKKPKQNRVDIHLAKLSKREKSH